MPLVDERNVDGTKTIVAFDGMHIAFRDLSTAARVTPAVDVLFEHFFRDDTAP